jgi:hypothetical protein
MDTKCLQVRVNEDQVAGILAEFPCDSIGRPLIEFDWIWGGIILFVVVVAWFLVGYPFWAVWASKKSGQAQLSEANFAEQVAIAQARARLSAAEMNMQAEIVEADAISQSIATIGDALEKNPSYNRFQWIKMMEKGNNATIYVPTEANLPILEAGKAVKAKSEANEG